MRQSSSSVCLDADLSRCARAHEISRTRAIAPGTYSLGLGLRNSRYLGDYSAQEKENDGSSEATISPAKADDARAD